MKANKIVISFLATMGMTAFVAAPASATRRPQVKLFHQNRYAVNTDSRAADNPVQNNTLDFLFHLNQNYSASNGYGGGSNNPQSNAETLSSSWLDNWPANSPMDSVHFTTNAYLPTSYNYTNNYLSPQGIAVSKDGNTAYEIGHFNDGVNGQIIKFNLGDLKNKFQTDQNGSMQLIRVAAQWAKTGKKTPKNVTKAQTAANNAQKKVNEYKKVKYRKWHKRKYCKKHHIKYHSKKWIKNHNRWVKSHNKWLQSKKIKARIKKYKKTATSKWNTYNNAQNSWNQTADKYNGILADIQQGQPFQTGHGQALAINPTNGSLWYMNYEASQGNPQYMAEIDQNTLTPKTENIITDKEGNDVNLGHSFTFDKDGNAWFWVYKDGNKDNYSSVLKDDNKKVGIYEAKSNEVTSSKVNFKEKVDLQAGPGTYQQNCGYNKKTDRFYLVSDSSFISVPLGKIGGQLKPEDVHAFKLDPFNDSSKFNDKDNDGGRESEGFAFDQNGTGYFLSNRGPELFTTPDLLNDK